MGAIDKGISLDLILKRHLHVQYNDDMDIDNQEPKDEINIEQSLKEITHLRLDRENLTSLEGLELASASTTHLYLQHNALKNLDNLLDSGLINLRFITLAHNNIEKLPDLTPLNNLWFMDVSNNNIDLIHSKYLPKVLKILNIENNPCCNEETIRELKSNLLNLEQLNNESSNDDDDGVDDLTCDLTDDTEVNGSSTIKLLACDILMRSQSRLEEATIKHYQKMLKLNNYKFLENAQPPPENAQR